jgi:hypothetical protein
MGESILEMVLVFLEDFYLIFYLENSNHLQKYFSNQNQEKYLSFYLKYWKIFTKQNHQKREIFP